MNLISILLLSAVVIAFLCVLYNNIKGGNDNSCCKGCNGDCGRCSMT